jgi:hypothetical protein
LQPNLPYPQRLCFFTVSVVNGRTKQKTPGQVTTTGPIRQRWQPESRSRPFNSLNDCQNGAGILAARQC